MSSAAKIAPCPWFDGEAEEAVKFHLSVFRNPAITGVTRCGDSGPGAKGTVLTIAFTLDGRDVVALPARIGSVPIFRKE